MYVCLHQPHPLYNRSPLPYYLTTAVLNDYYSEIMAYTALAYSYWAATRMDAYITPTNDTDYSCHIKALEHI